MSLVKPPINYQIYNDQDTKKLAIVVDIEGADYLTTTTIGRKLQYGDPYNYGDPILIYGGLVPIGVNPTERGQKKLISLDNSSLTISQKLEPEQGRAGISIISLSFVDVNKYMTQLITPGVILDEILGKPVKVWIGYAQTSFPDDYFVLWRGRISQVNAEVGRVSFQMSDANTAKRQNIFYKAKTKLASTITSGATTIPVVSNGDFHKKISGPDGLYDQSTKLYLKIEDEFIEYQQTGFENTGFGVNQFLNVSRGARSTTATAHAGNTDVDVYVELSGRAIDLALKLMLSGWGGNYIEDKTIQSIVITNDINNPTENNTIVLPYNIDAVRDYGINVGDYVTVTGSAVPANNTTAKVTGFIPVNNQNNRGIITDFSFTAEPTTTGTLSVRSQYDVLPVTCGCKLPGYEVNVSDHLYYQNTYLNGLENSYRFFIQDQEAGKTFIENQIMLPLGAYALTRQGKISMGLTKPPIADERTSKLDISNVLEPVSIKLQRGTNNRKFFNEIQWDYDYNDSNEPTSVRKTVDTDSLNLINQSSVLPIQAQGARTDLGFNIIVERRERFLLLRYANAAVLVDIKTNFGTGNQIEAGDVVILDDQGNLQIPNMSTGERNYGVQLLEVINRSVDLKSGVTQLTLQGGLGALADDRYATISPSSLTDVGCTTTHIRIKESFGAIYPSQEYLKWQDYASLRIVVHSYDYSVSEETVFVGLDPGDPHVMIVSPALSFTPPSDYIVDIVDFPNNTDALDQGLYKLVHAFVDPTVTITSGVSTTSFNVALIDASKFKPGFKVIVHNDSYTIASPEVSVLSVVGTLVTVDTSLGFTPSAGQKADLLGFPDSSGPYRFV